MTLALLSACTHTLPPRAWHHASWACTVAWRLKDPVSQPSRATACRASAKRGSSTKAGTTHIIKALSYNILAQKYTTGGWHSYCPAQHLEWESRLARILEELSSYDCDIVCLQEVEAGAFAGELQPWMAARGFEGHYLARQFGENVQGPPEGVALFYRSSLFDLVDHQAVTFSRVATTPEPPSALSSSDEPDILIAIAEPAPVQEPPAAAAAAAAGGGSRPSTSSGMWAAAAAAAAAAAGGGQPGPRVQASGGGGGSSNTFWKVFMRRQEGAILALLRHRPSQRLLLAGVTHLFWNPAYPDVKAFQAAVLCQRVAALLAPWGGPPQVAIVVGGDFNSLWRKYLPDTFDPKIPSGGFLTSGVYTLLAQGTLLPDHPDHPAARRRPGETANAAFRDTPLDAAQLTLASSHMLAHGREPPLTTRTSTFGGALDYVWVSPQHLRVRDTLTLPYKEPRSWRDPLKDVAFGPIPDQDFPSDHIAVGCVLEMQQQQQQQQ